jgi:hypothetical protein
VPEDQAHADQDRSEVQREHLLLEVQDQVHADQDQLEVQREDPVLKEDLQEEEEVLDLAEALLQKLHFQSARLFIITMPFKTTSYPSKRATLSRSSRKKENGGPVNFVV